VTDRDGKKMKKKRLLPSKKRRGKNVQKRASKEAVEFPITLGFVIAWIGIIILHGALGGRFDYWREMPYGVGYPPIQNAMNRDAFYFMRQYIHFEDNLQVPKRRERLTSNVQRYAGIFQIMEKANHVNNVRVNQKDRKGSGQQRDV